MSFPAPACFSSVRSFATSGLTQRMLSLLCSRGCALLSLLTQEVPLLSCSSQLKLGPRRTVNPLAFRDLSPLCALNIPLQSAGPQELDQPLSMASFSYGVLHHTQHRACRTSLLVERNPNHSFPKVVMRQWFKVLFSSSKVLKFITE